jgi:hypothetical protein
MLLKACEYNVDTVSLNVTEALNSNRDYVILDNSLMEIISCESTNGGYDCQTNGK